jgi:hypothetical protein
MKRNFLFAATSLLLGLSVHLTAMAQNGNATATVKGSQITFSEKSHDFGDIRQGDKVNYTFKFTNTGTEPLILSRVETTCGCTATNWTHEPVAPGKTGEVSATFNSAGKMNAQRKVIKIYSNAVNPEETVTIVTNVLPKPAEE